MGKQELAAGYDPLAWFYNRYWGNQYHDRIVPLVERTVLSRIPPGGHVLDLCCGTGFVTGQLIAVDGGLSLR